MRLLAVRWLVKAALWLAAHPDQVLAATRILSKVLHVSEDEEKPAAK